MTEITHQIGDDGHYVQIVTPRTLRRILRRQGETLRRPADFGPGDEWDVGSSRAAYRAIPGEEG